MTVRDGQSDNRALRDRLEQARLQKGVLHHRLPDAGILQALMTRYRTTFPYAPTRAAAEERERALLAVSPGYKEALPMTCPAPRGQQVSVDGLQLWVPSSPERFQQGGLPFKTILQTRDRRIRTVTSSRC